MDSQTRYTFFMDNGQTHALAKELVEGRHFSSVAYSSPHRTKCLRYMSCHLREPLSQVVIRTSPRFTTMGSAAKQVQCEAI